MNSLKKTVHQNYHWVIAAIVFAQMIVYGGIINSMSVYLIPVTEGLGISRGTYSWMILLQNLSATFGTMITALAFRRFGFRTSMIVATILTTVSCLISAAAPNVYIYAVGRLVLGLGYGICLTAGATWIVKDWFHKHHGLVLGIITMGTGVGGSLLTSLLMFVIQTLDWRWAFLVTAILQCVVTLFCLFLRNTPEEMGLKPYGEGHMPKNAKRDTDDHWEGFSMAQLKKKPVFYLMVLGTLLSSVCGYMALSVVSPHIQDCGMSPEFAAGVQSVVMIGLAVTKLMFGALSDKVGAKLMTLVSLVSLVASMLLLANVSNAVSAYIAALVYALALPLCGIVPPLLLPSLFGYGSGVKAIGIMYAMLSTASMIANPLTNTLRDRFGSYRPVFQGTAVVAIGVTALYILLYVLAAKERKKLEQQTSNESE
jgi:predicted MFS family arabinose efflux permease